MMLQSVCDRFAILGEEVQTPSCSRDPVLLLIAD